MSLEIQYNKIIETIGVPASIHYTKGNLTLNNIKVGIRSIGTDDEVLINTLGVGAKIITIMAKDILNRPPVKFDVVLVNSEKYTIESVDKIHLPTTGKVIAYKCFVQGA